MHLWCVFMSFFLAIFFLSLVSIQKIILSKWAFAGCWFTQWQNHDLGLAGAELDVVTAGNCIWPPTSRELKLTRSKTRTQLNPPKCELWKTKYQGSHWWGVTITLVGWHETKPSIVNLDLGVGCQLERKQSSYLLSLDFKPSQKTIETLLPQIYEVPKTTAPTWVPIW